MNSKSKQESKILWQYYRIKFPTQKGLPSAIPCEDMNAFVYINVIPKCHSLASYGTGLRVLFGWRAKFYSMENTLIPNREQGAIFDLVGSFDINIRGDPHLVPLSLEGLSKATTCIPHRICSMWMTCVNVMPMHGHTKEPAEFIGVQHRGACDFPRALLEWIGPHVVEMEALLHQVWTVGVIVRTSSVDFWSLSWLYELACVRLESPHQVVKSITRGVLYSLCWRENGSNFWPRAYATMKWNCLKVMDVSWLGEAEALSYNAMSVCECTFEYSGVGVQSDAYIWVQR